MGPRLPSTLLAGALLAAAASPSLAQLAPGGPSQVSAGGAAPVVNVAGQTTDITLGAPRTVMNWSSYDLAADQTVVYRFGGSNWIVLNRVSGQASIDGQVEAFVGDRRGAGNVWFSAPGGVIFGPNARVNVGGLMATPGAVAASFLDATTYGFDVSGAGAASVEVRAGAQIRSGGGPVVLVARNVSTAPGSVISGVDGATVLYGAAGDFTVRFAPQSGDLDLLDFLVPAAGGSSSATPLSLQGQTQASNVYLAVVNRGDVASAVVNATGVVSAQAAGVEGGDVVLTAGAGIVAGQPSATRINTTTATTLTLGVAVARRDLLAGFSAPTTVTATQLAAGRDLGVAAGALDVALLTAGRTLAADIGGALTVRTLASGGAVSLRVGGALNAPGAVDSLGQLQLTVGSAQIGQAAAGRSLTVNGAGAVSIGQAVVADDLSITTANGSINLGRAAFTGQGGDGPPAGRNLSLTAGGAQADVTLGAGAGTPLSGATSVTVSAGRDATLSVAGDLRLNSGRAGGVFTIRARDLDIAGPISATDIRIESLAGALTLGDAPSGGAGLGASAAPLPGLRLSQAEFDRLLAQRLIAIYAGSPAGGELGDLSVLGLSVDPAHAPRLLLAAGGDFDVRIPGSLSPIITGGVLQVGESDPSSAFRPGRILVSGEIGHSVGNPEAGYRDIRGFEEVILNGRRDVILGSDRFIALIAATPPGDIDIARNQPEGSAPTANERDRVFLTAGFLSASASERIVQQNTGVSANIPNGIYLLNNPLSPRDSVLIVAPAQVVDLFGAFRDRDGQFRAGLQAGGLVRISGGGRGGFIRFNGCGVGGGCGATPETQSFIPQTLARASRLMGELTAADGDAARILPPRVLSAAEPTTEEVLGESTTLGSGNEEVWRRKRPRR